MLAFFKQVLQGAVVGAANIIPGVSGGTMAVILGIYDRLIGSISGIRKKPKESILFLIPILLGAGLAILLCSRGIEYLLDHFYMAVNFFFVGIILGSIPMIYRRATEGGLKAYHWLASLITFGIMIIMLLLEDQGETAADTVLSFSLAIRLFLASAVAAAAMLIPGISGSFMMLLMGVYTTIITAINQFNIMLLMPIGLGVLAGLVGGAFIIRFLLEKFPQFTYFAILGCVAGSVPVLFGKIVSTGNMAGGTSLIIPIFVLVLGGLITLAFDSGYIRELFRKEKS